MVEGYFAEIFSTELVISDRITDGLRRDAETYVRVLNKLPLLSMNRVSGS
jgi:hypothetical protein